MFGSDGFAESSGDGVDIYRYLDKHALRYLYLCSPGKAVTEEGGHGGYILIHMLCSSSLGYHKVSPYGYTYNTPTPKPMIIIRKKPACLLV